MYVIILKKVVFHFSIIFAANLTTYEDVLHRCLNLKRFQHRRDPSMLDRARSLPITMAITMAIHSIHLDFIRYLSQARRFHIFFCWAVFLPTHFFCRSPLDISGIFANLSVSFNRGCLLIFFCLDLIRAVFTTKLFSIVFIQEQRHLHQPSVSFNRMNNLFALQSSNELQQSLRSAIFKWVATNLRFLSIVNVCSSSFV